MQKPFFMQQEDHPMKLSQALSLKSLNLPNIYGLNAEKF